MVTTNNLRSNNIVMELKKKKDREKCHPLYDLATKYYVHNSHGQWNVLNVCTENLNIRIISESKIFRR